jgi:hypothetical protein
MRIPVLMVASKQEPLVESAQAGLDARASNIPMSATRMPAGVEIDPSFAAVPLGMAFVSGAALDDASHAAIAAAAAAPATSEAFVVRAFVESDRPEDIPAERDGQPLFADPAIAPFLTCGGSAPVGTNATVATKLNVAGLAAKGLDGNDVAIAIMDTGINLNHLKTKLGFTPAFDLANSWKPPGGTTQPGQHPVNHGTMCAYDALIAAPKATLLDFPILANPSPGGSFVGQTISMALLGFSQLLAFWAVAFAPGGAPRFKALVSNNSWGVYHPSWDFPAGHPGRFIDNPNHPFHIIVSTVVRSGADVIFAAGNCGAQCPDGRCQGRTAQAIMGSSAHPDVLTLAGCDTNDQRVGYSSQGPSIAGMSQQKPDVTAYAHFRGSEAFGPGSPDSGTSTACPVAAGCVAALRTSAKAKPATIPPAQLFNALRQTARRPAGTGWNSDMGFGIIDPMAAAANLGL